MQVSDEAVEKLKRQLVLSREHWKKIQHMSREEMGAYLVDYYRIAFEAGGDAAVPEHPWEEVMDVIRNVKGVGPALAERINKTVKEKFEE